MNSNEKKEVILKLVDCLKECFDIHELQDLCLSLEIEFQDLPGELTLSSKIRELVSYMYRRGLLAELVRTVEAIRSNYSWPNISTSTFTSPSNTNAPNNGKKEKSIGAYKSNSFEILQNVYDNMNHCLLNVLPDVAQANLEKVCPNIQGVWLGIVNGQKSHVVINQIGSLVYLTFLVIEENADNTFQYKFGYKGEGKLISSNLIFRWNAGKLNRGLNIMKVFPGNNAIEGYYFSGSGGSGNERYDKLSEEHSSEETK